MLALLLSSAASAQTDRALQKKQMAEVVDTSKFKKPGPYTIGVAAGYMSNSWVVFCLQHIRYEASLHKEIKDVIVTDAAFNPAKQVADIEDLIAKNVSLIIYWPVDEKAIQPALQKAVAKGIPTVNAGGGFTLHAGHGVERVHRPVGARRDGGTAVRQGPRRQGQDLRDAADRRHHGRGRPARRAEDGAQGPPEDRAAERPSTATGTAPRPSRSPRTCCSAYPKIDGVFSPAGQMSMGVAEAFEEAGRMKGWSCRPATSTTAGSSGSSKNKQGGAVTFPTRAGQEATKLGLKILNGEPVPRGLVIPSEYIAPADAAKYAEMNRPDDWWASKLAGRSSSRSDADAAPDTAPLLDIARAGQALRQRRGARRASTSRRTRGEVHALTGANGAGKSTLHEPARRRLPRRAPARCASTARPVRFGSPGRRARPASAPSTRSSRCCPS